MLSATELNRLMSAVEAQDRITGSGSASVQRNGGGFQITADSVLFIFARITGSPTGANYPWTEIYYDDSTTAWIDGGRSGTAAVCPAREINGDTAVASGTRVRMELSPAGDSYLFSQMAGGSGGTMNHNLLDGSVHPDTVAQTVSRGSLVYGNSTPKWDELTIGASGTVLRSDGTDAAWSTDTHNLLSARHADTAAQTVSRGSLIYGNSTPAWDELTIGAAGTVLVSDGTDAAWGADAHNLLSTRHGDTSAAAAARGALIVGNSTPLWSRLTIGSSGTVLKSDGTDAAWSTDTHNLLSARHADTTASTVAKGSLVVGSATAWDDLTVGANGTILVADSAETLGVKWATPAAGMGHVLLDGAVHTDTLAGTVVLGDIIHGNGTPKWARLAGTTSALRQKLTQTGAGGVSAVPAWKTDWRLLLDDTTQYTNPTNETDYTVYTLPGGTLSAEGDGIRVEVGGTHPALNSGRFRVRFDGDVVFDSGTFANDADPKMWSLHGRIVRTSSTTIKASFMWTSSVAALIATAYYATVTATLSGDVELKTTGDDIGTGDGITQELLQVVFEPAS